jgi:iron(II)-dependent oxidoreductase
MQSLPLEAERVAFMDAYERNRRRSALLSSLPNAEAYEQAPIPLRHPFVFYDGHIPAFSFLTLVRFALQGEAIDEKLERLFRRGIDPDGAREAAQSAPPSWPSRATVHAFSNECDFRVRAALSDAPLDEPENPWLANAQAVHVIIEHEQMHHETLAYILHRLALEKKQRVRCTYEDRPVEASRRIHIDAGLATLGADRAGADFGWDNEFPASRVPVNAFDIDANNVTNEDFAAFVEAGAQPPPFWLKQNGQWKLLAQFDIIPLPNSWPVYVSHDQATAYAAWKGMRLPTEAEYHRAAFGTRDGKERAHPWGNELADATRGNFDFARYDPMPVGSYPAGASAWGVNDLVGNGWEWTSTIFAPFDGFRPMTSYPVYSADFFDGKHYVMKGASPVTDRRLIRRTFRNWFRADYPYAYATFRCVTH